MLFKTLLVIVLCVPDRSKSVSVSVSPSGEIVEGSSVTLTCSSDANQPVQRFTWYKNNRAVSPWGGSDRSFTIKSITLQDAGEYTCQTWNTIGTERSPPKHLDVQYPPKSVSVSVSPSGEIVEGRSVALTCSSDANPAEQKYAWYKKTGFVFSRRGSERSYTIKNITLQDAGEYYCEAENAIGTKRSPPKHLDVQYAPKNTAVSVPPPGEIVEGKSVTLTCSSDANPSVQRYTWFKNRAELSWRGSSNTIKSITLQDGGEYYCKAQNRIGTDRSSPKRLDVLYPPKNVSVSVSPSGEIVEGSSVTLTCSSDANPPVQKYTCYTNYRAVSSETGGPEVSYTIKNISLEDAGEYYCEAQNKIGKTTSAPKHFDVQYPPKSTSVSVSPSGEIMEGSSVTLTCSSDGNPPVQNYTWYKKNKPVSSETGGPEDSYTIKSITLHDAVEYICVAQNRIGIKRSPPKRPDVLYAPKNTSVSVSPSGEIEEGSSVTLTCSSDANPPVQNYTWVKKNDTGVWQAGSGQSLNFSNFRSWDRGQYYCEAQNRLGAQNASALPVTVQGGQSLIVAAAVGVAEILALVFLGVCLRRRKSTNETEGDRQGNKSPIDGNVSGMAMSHTGTQDTDTDDGDDLCSAR